MTRLLLVLLLPSALWSQVPGAEELSGQAAALAARQDHAGAEQLWQQALRQEPTLFSALFNLGLLRYSQARYADAEPVLAQAVRVRPAEFQPRYLLGATLVQLGKRDEALLQWRAARKLQPGNVRLLQAMAVEYGKGRYFQEAAEAASVSLRLSPQDLTAHFLAIKAYQDAGETSQAQSVACAAAQRFADSARAQFECGFHLQKLGQTAAALERLERSIALDPRYEEPYFFSGDLLVKQGEHEKAMPYLRSAIRNRPQYMAARVTLARAHMGLQQWDAALQELQEAVRLAPKHPQPHLLLSQVYYRLGDEERAKQEKELSLRLRREDPTALEAEQGRRFPASP